MNSNNELLFENEVQNECNEWMNEWMNELMPKNDLLLERFVSCFELSLT